MSDEPPDAIPETPALAGRRILVTRPADGSSLAARLDALGASVLELPTTRMEPLDPAPLHAALSRLDDYAWLVVTSRNAVRILVEEMRRTLHDPASLRAKIAAVGAATADELRAAGVRVDVIPDRYVAEGVLEALARRDDVAETRILYACAEGARDVLPTGLRELGADVEVIPIYRSVVDQTRASALRTAMKAARIDLVTFTSASTVRGFVDAVGPDAASRIPAATIGPVTTDAARAAGITVRAEAEMASVDGLVDAVVRALSAER